MLSTSHVLFESLVHGPLLVGDLPEACTFPHQNLVASTSADSLNYEQKLGYLYEDVLAVLLETSPDYEVRARNLQIQDDCGNTIGELDFLLRDVANGQFIHLELATKFYLAVKTENGLELPGPDARDNYFKKLQRLRDHQLTLTRLHRDALPIEFRHVHIVTRQLIYGCLFDHIHADEPATPLFISPSCRRGRWLMIDECREYFPAETRIHIIPKHLWPVPLELLANIPLEPWNQSTHIDRCLMIRAGEASTPYFVTPSNYPYHCPIAQQ